jgi:two-component system, OmpR family, alkaline phosphatase synthesis response regulator PhoP
MKSSGNKRILVVEDDQHIAEGLRLNLALKGYEPQIALDGIAALRLWKEWKPGLIVLDIMLPHIDGLTVLRNIRLEDERLPVLILSARGEPEQRVEGLALGGDDYLAKPFNLDEFLLRVERLFARTARARERDDEQRQAHTPSPAMSLTSTDSRRTAERLKSA